MPKQLKGVIIGINDVLVTQGPVNDEILNGLGRLVQFLRSRNITPVFFGNREWWMSNGSGNEKPRRSLQEIITERWGEFPWIVANRDGTPKKPTAAAIAYILERFGWDRTEVIYVGNSVEDMVTAVNGSVLFLNAIWYGQHSDYGFIFKSPLDVARFIDTFCLRAHLWHYAIEQNGLKYYALAPYSTMIQAFAYLSGDARDAAKFGGGHPDFWTKYLWSTIYFSELYNLTMSDSR